MRASLSPNHDERPADTPIDMLVLHYTGMPSAQAAIDRLCDPASRVSAHYLIDDAGSITPLVPEDRRAWHAGVSYWRGHRDVNGRSIGIEIVNPGHEFGYTDFPDRQITSLVDLGHEILDRHPIPARNVVGHSDIAPARKQDPGELFPWSVLAESGIGLWPQEPFRGTDEQAVPLLCEYGYEPGLDPAILISAFQRHFRPEQIDGVADDTTVNRLATLVEIAGLKTLSARHR